MNVFQGISIFFIDFPLITCFVITIEKWNRKVPSFVSTCVRCWGAYSAPSDWRHPLDSWAGGPTTTLSCAGHDSPTDNMHTGHREAGKNTTGEGLVRHMPTHNEAGTSLCQQSAELQMPSFLQSCIQLGHKVNSGMGIYKACLPASGFL